jgi:pimeloyl-ACP methyl ester carboxylesterase
MGRSETTAVWVKSVALFVSGMIRRLAKAAGVGLATVGGLAAVNAALAGRAEPLEQPLSGADRTYRWRGMDVAYTEAGEPDAPTVVFLHGINAAGSSGEFRAVFDDLACDYHVVAPDLPGFGRSDRPSLQYSAALYEDFVADFLSEYDAPAVVVSSLTAAYVARALADPYGDVSVSSLVAVCPTARGGPDRVTWARELLRAPVVGTALFNLLASKPSIRYFNADHGYYDMASVSDEWMAYEWQTAHQPNARFAPASFVSGFLNSDIDLGPALRKLDVPVTFVWGREADITPLSAGRDLAEEADARLVVIDDAKLLPHVEHPGAFLDVVRESFAVPV